MNDSHLIVRDERVTSYIGSDATLLFQAKVIIAGLKAVKLGMRLSRSATPTNLLAKAGQICGKKYKRGQYDLAIADLQQWTFAMYAALPIIVEESK